MSGPVATDPVPLATADDFMRRYKMMAQDFDPIVIEETMVEATAHIESMVSRRLAPFTNHVYEDRLYGIDPTEYGGTSNGIPLPWQGSLGVSYANALGAGDLVRHFWLDQFAPVYPELWSYNLQSIILQLTYGNTMPIDILNGGITGPAITDGHVWMRLGTFAPIGTRITVTYGGGYTNGIPPDLRRACIYQAAAFLIKDAEPQNRPNVNSDALDAMIIQLLAPWSRA
jgi:hypothetical protein